MVDILLAVYNGGKFLKKQLDSIFAQTYRDFLLIVCDDGSTDDSRQLLEEYQKRFVGQMQVIYNDKNLGAKNNFFKLLSLSKAEYIMFCDQDDIWDKNKVEKTLDFFRKNEDSGVLLVHTDMRVIDENDVQTAESFNKLQSIDPYQNSLNKLLVQNTVTGCTVMINRALADIVLQPRCDTLHDWWLAVTAAAFGKIAYLPEATMGYRRHSQNVRGARDMSSPKYILSRAADKSDAAAMLGLGYEQSAEFAAYYKDKLDKETLKMLEAYGDCAKCGKLKKLKTIFRYKIFKQGLVRKIGQLIYM